MRKIVAFFAAPLLPALLPAYAAYQHQTYMPIAAYIGWCGLIYAAQVVIGIPAYAVLRRRKWNQIWVYALLGFSGLALPSLGLVFYRWDEKGYGYSDLALLCIPGIYGLLSGVMFWVIGRPDKAIGLVGNSPQR